MEMRIKEIFPKLVKGTLISLLISLSLYVFIQLGTITLGQSFQLNTFKLFQNILCDFSKNVFTSGSIITERIATNNQEDAIFTVNQLSQGSVYLTYLNHTRLSGNSIKVVYQDNPSNNNLDDSDLIVDNSDLPEDNLAPTPPPKPVEPIDPALIIDSEIYFEDNDEYDPTSEEAQTVFNLNATEALNYNKSLISNLKEKMDTTYLINNFYRVNGETGIDHKIFDVKALLTKDLSMTLDSKKPQILILHTHAHEAFSDSREGKKEDTIIGVGETLKDLLESKYGYQVIHHTKQYSYNTAYNDALPDIKAILKKYPTIKVIFDIHRDGAGDNTHTYFKDNYNLPMAMIMFFNGVSHNLKGPREGLENPNLQSNLAFSLQMKLYAMTHYPELTRKNSLKSYRYNMHLAARYSLIEVGDQNNTVAEAKNAMVPLADAIHHVLSGGKNK